MILNHFKLIKNQGVENFLAWTNPVSLNMFVFGATAPSGPGPCRLQGFLDHTQRRTTVGRTLLDEWSACRRDLYLTTHNTHNRQASMLPVVFKYTIQNSKVANIMRLFHSKMEGVCLLLLTNRSMSLCWEAKYVTIPYQKLGPAQKF
jgi:hypothetical protein